MTTDYDALVAIAARDHALDRALVTAIMLVESSGQTDAYRYERRWAVLYAAHPKAVGLVKRRYAGSYGLMQIGYMTATDYGFSTEPEFLFLPHVGLDYGCQHLRALMDWAKGDAPKATGAYNAGKGNYATAAAMAYRAKVQRVMDGLA